MPATGPSFYTRVFPAGMSVSSGDIPGIVAFQITAPSQGSQYWIDGHGPWPLRSNFSMKVPKRIEVDAAGNRRAIPCPVQFQSGATSPLEVLFVMDSDPENEELGGSLEVGAPASPLYQETDLIPAGSGTVVGQLGAPSLYRNPASPNNFIIPSAPTVNGSGQVQVSLNNPNLSRSIAAYDTTTGAGAAQDTGAVGISTTADALWIEVVFSAVLTGSRTIDLLVVRPDASQYSLFDPIRDAAPTIAIGSRNYYAALGQFVGAQFFGAATAAINLAVPGILPIGQSSGGSSGFRVNLGAGGAESTRIRILIRSGTIT
jgi:hypothetical protein